MENKSENDIIYLKNYGKIRIDLQSLLDARHITKNKLATKIVSRPSVIAKWCDGSVERMDLDVLARICYYFGCEPQDILRYEPPGDEDPPSKE